LWHNGFEGLQKINWEILHLFYTFSKILEPTITNSEKTLLLLARVFFLMQFNRLKQKAAYILPVYKSAAKESDNVINRQKK